MLVLTAVLLALSSDVDLELELGGGFAHPLEQSTSSSGGFPFAAPVLQSRLALDMWDALSAGVTFLAVMGGEAANRTSGVPDTGNGAFKATALLASLRVHSSRPIQVWAEGGLGVGHLISLQTDNSLEHAPLRGRAGLSTRLAAGIRSSVGKRLLLGGELGVASWHNVESGPTGPYGDRLSGLSTSAVTLVLSLTFSLFER